MVAEALLHYLLVVAVAEAAVGILAVVVDLVLAGVVAEVERVVAQVDFVLAVVLAGVAFGVDRVVAAAVEFDYYQTAYSLSLYE
jgi:hypothetical protein